MVMIYNLDAESVSKIIQIDLAGLDEEPESSIGNFSFHGCMGGVSAIKGRPPWEFHGQGEELLFVLAGESELTVLEMALVPYGTFHKANLQLFPGAIGTPTMHRAE
jgi:hypothetical protein